MSQVPVWACLILGVNAISRRIHKGDSVMRYKILALTLALSIMTWAQTSSQPVNPDHPQSAAPVEKARCGCCDKMASGQTNDAHASCTQAGAKTKNAQEMGSCCSGKEAANSCCSDKDAGSCVRADKGQNA